MSHRIPFAKMHGAGNDFIMIDHRDLEQFFVHPERDDLAAFDDLPGNQLDQRRVDVLEHLDGGVADLEDLGQNPAELAFVDVAELDQAGPEVAAVDQLRLERLLELILCNEALLNQNFAKSHLTPSLART